MGRRSKRKKHRKPDFQDTFSEGNSDIHPKESVPETAGVRSFKIPDLLLAVVGMLAAWYLAVSIRSEYLDNTGSIPDPICEHIKGLNSTLDDREKITAHVQSIRNSDARNENDQQILALYGQWEASRTNKLWQNRHLPTTHDSYLYSAIIHRSHQDSDPKAKPKGCPSTINHGAVTMIGAILVKGFGVHPADVITYLPVYMAGLLAIPMVLLGRFLGSTFVGICAACIAVVAFSYFNRTNAGYFDTDIFSVTLPALGLYFLLEANRKKSLLWLTPGALIIFSFPFFYNSGAPIVAALGAAFMGFQFLTYCRAKILKADFDPRFAITSTAILSLAIANGGFTTGANLESRPGFALLALLVVAIACIFSLTGRRFMSEQGVQKGTTIMACLGLIWMIGFSDSFSRIRSATLSYLPEFQNKVAADHREQQATQSLVYKNVRETIVEAKKSPWSELMMRISGSTWGCALAVVGYAVLVALRPELIIALPFVGIGVFAHWGGHRFTIHAVPIAALSAAFLPLAIVEACRRGAAWMNIPVPANSNWPEQPGESRQKFPAWFYATSWALGCSAILTFFMVDENKEIASDRSFALTSVLNNSEVQLLDDLKHASQPGDYVHSWWDWGTAIWTHSERNVLTTPANQSTDTFIMAKMLMTDSPRLAAHLGLASTEFHHHKDGTAVSHLLGGATQENPPTNILSELKAHLPVRPQRDSYIYLPNKLLRFYGVLEQFSERDLVTGELWPRSRWDICSGYRTDGTNNVVLMHPHNPSVPYKHVDLNTLVMADMANPWNAHQVHRSLQQGQQVQEGIRFVALRSKDGRLVYADSKLKALGDDFVFHPVSSKQPSQAQRTPMAGIHAIYPAERVKQVFSDTGFRRVTGDEYNEPGLSVVVRQDPPVALLVDDKAFNSQMMQLLVLGQPDPKYFVQVAHNPGGRVYRIKHPEPGP